MVKGGLCDHGRIIFANFYDQNPEYLKIFDDLGNEVLHKHTEEVFLSIDKLIEGLNDPETFDCELNRISKAHDKISQSAIEKLSKIIIEFLIKKLSKHKTKTLKDALDVFFAKIKSKFIE